MQRQRLFVVAMLLILGMTFNSCMQDDRELLSEQQLSASSRSEVRDFQEHFLGVYDEDKLRAAFSGNEFTPLEFKGLRPFWDKAHVNKLGSELEVIEVPLSADELDIVFPQLLSVEELKKYQGKTYHLSLIRERNLKTQKVKEFFLCYVPNIETLEKGLPDYYHLLSLPKDFSGELILFDLQLKPFYRYNIERGHTKERYLHVEKGREELRAWIWTERCHVLMHENGWSVLVTPRRTTTFYDPNNHYFTTECHGMYTWMPEPGLEYQPIPAPPNGFMDDLNKPPMGYYEYPKRGGGGGGGGGGGSATVNHLYPEELSKGLLGIVNPEGITGFTSDELVLLSKTYEGMLAEHPIHKRLDQLLKSYPNFRKLNGIALLPESDKGSASVSNGYKLNFYGKQYVTTKVLFHEWIHMAQMHKHQLFNPKTSSLDIVKFRERRGIMEFEGFLIRDIIKYVEGKGKFEKYDSEPFALRGNGPRTYGIIYIDSDYGAWLSEMTDKGKFYPKYLIDREKFRKFANKFLDTHPSYPRFYYPLKDSLVYEPSLIDELFNLSKKEE